jgi:hypothetical protein
MPVSTSIRGAALVPLLLLLVPMAACATAAPAPTVAVTTVSNATGDCGRLEAVLGVTLTSLQSIRAKEDVFAVIAQAEGELRAVGGSDHDHALVAGYRSLFHDLRAAWASAARDQTDYLARAKALDPHRPSFAALRKRCGQALPADEDDTSDTSDCSRVNALIAKTREPFAGPSTSRSAEAIDRLERLALSDPELVRLRPSIVQSLRIDAALSTEKAARDAKADVAMQAFQQREDALAAGVVTACGAAPKRVLR